MFIKADFFERTDWMLTLNRRRLLLRCVSCLDGDDEHSGLELVNESGESPNPAPAMTADAGELKAGELMSVSDSDD